MNSQSTHSTFALATDTELRSYMGAVTFTPLDALLAGLLSVHELNLCFRV